MLESFLSDFSYLKDSFDEKSETNLFGRQFSFFDAEPMLFYHTSKDAIVYINSRFTDEFEYTVDDLAAWQYSIYPMFSKEAVDLFKTAIAGLNQEGASPFKQDVEYQLLAKNKDSKYYRLKVGRLHKEYYFIQFSRSSVMRPLAVLQNKTTDDFIQDAESLLEFGFWMMDGSTEKLYWTKGMYHLMETEPDQVTLTLPEYRNRIIKDKAFYEFETKLREDISINHYKTEYSILTYKNNTRIVAEYGRIQRDAANGSIKQITGLIKDITEQQLYLKSFQDFKLMMEENETFLHYGSWEANAEGKTIFCTKGMYDIFGIALNAEQILFDKVNDINSKLLPESTAADMYLKDIEIVDNKGELRIISAFGKVFRDARGITEKILGTFRDVTLWRENERNLEQKVIELNRSNAELEVFAYVASHDLQEPLRKIATFGQRLKSHFSTNLEEQANDYLTRMLNAADSMHHLIDSLLAFSKINRDNQTYTPVSLSNIVEQVIEDLNITIQETGARIISASLPTIEADAAQMKQLFFNLLHNAIKFRKRDVPLLITIESKLVTMEEKKERGLVASKVYYLITVADNGIGLPEVYSEKIFNLFQRLEGKSAYPGSGIGLSICRKIVSRYQGIILATGEPDKGAVFSIYLPQSQQKSNA